jgi:hypothetical protein
MWVGYYVHKHRFAYDYSQSSCQYYSSPIGTSFIDIELCWLHSRKHLATIFSFYQFQKIAPSPPWVMLQSTLVSTQWLYCASPSSPYLARLFWQSLRLEQFVTWWTFGQRFQENLRSTHKSWLGTTITFGRNGTVELGRCCSSGPEIILCWPNMT